MSEDIKKLYRQDPRRGFDRLYFNLANRIATWLNRSFLLSIEEISDIVHDSFLPWVEHPERMREVENPRAYIFTTARKIAFKRRREHANTVLQSETFAATPTKDTTQQLEVAIDIETALTKLPEEQREVVALKIWCDLTFEEIAEIQGVSINTASARYRYALQKLQEILK